MAFAGFANICRKLVGPESRRLRFRSRASSVGKADSGPHIAPLNCRELGVWGTGGQGGPKLGSKAFKKKLSGGPKGCRFWMKNAADGERSPKFFVDERGLSACERKPYETRQVGGSLSRSNMSSLKACKFSWRGRSDVVSERGYA